MAVAIEKMELGDWKRVRTLRLRALQDTPDAFASTFEEEERFEPEAWRERLASADAVTFFASIDGRDVGMATGAKYRGKENAAGLFGMWVAAESRRAGVGALLVEAVIDWARRGPYDRLLLDVSDGNEPAIALYARMGFEPTGVSGTLPPPREHVTEHERVLPLR